MQLKNTNEIQKIAKEIKPIMDLEIGWGNEILNTLIAVALDKYKKNVDANASFKELLLFVGIDGFLKIYAPIKPKAGVMNDRDHLYSNEVSWHEDYEYFVNALYNKFLEFNNIVKKVCTELGITQKELAEKLGASEGTVRNWSSSNELPQWALNFIETLIEHKKDKEIVTKFKELLNLIK
ncbi:helix-turn-helix domain-containing protein [Aliarcobacter cryaerophilus]|uniref:helix-turn-helix domain-containing protein n=1 Tax=Aliarcobacter cryaerophilus TaxID=28198 RepID=UPI003DA3ED7D